MNGTILPPLCNPVESEFEYHAKACIELDDISFIDWASRTNFIPNIDEQRVCSSCHQGHLKMAISSSTDRFCYRCDKCWAKRSIRLDSWTSSKSLPLRVLYLLQACWCEKLTFAETNRWLAQLDKNILSSIRHTLSQPANNNQLPLTNRKPTTIISRNTYYHYCSEFRQQATKFYQQDISTNPIGSLGHAVQIDESLFTRAKYNRGRNLLATPSWFFGSIDPNTHRIAVTRVAHRDANTLIPIILTTTLPGVTIYSDQWAAYNTLAAQGHPHFTVNHSIEFVNHTAIGDIHTQLIENQWHCIKEFLRQRKAYRRDNLESYIHEYCFRKNLADSFSKCWEYMNR